MHCCQNVTKNFKIMSFSIKNVEKSRYIRQKLSCPSFIMDIVNVWYDKFISVCYYCMVIPSCRSLVQHKVMHGCGNY